MPIYTYRCENCGVQFERTQKFTDPSLTRCPECNKKTLRKVYTPVGIVFKGSGFYATDHRSPSGQTSAKQAAAAEKAEKTPEPKVEPVKPASNETPAVPGKVEPAK
jgi:putative FmdB family regulatory protein